MAAGRFMFYTSALKYMMMGRINLQGGTIMALPLHDNYSPSTASHSALAQLTSFQATASATIVNAIALTSLVVTQSGVATAKFDAADIAGFSSDGSTIGSFKYLALYEQSASSGGGVDNLLIGFLDMDSADASASAGNATQVNVTWNSGGIAKLRGNP